MTFKFNLLSSNFFAVLGIIVGFSTLIALLSFSPQHYIIDTLIIIATLSPITLNYSCETDFDREVFLFRIKYLFIPIFTETYKVSDFDIYSYKMYSIRSRNSYDHPSINLKVYNSRKRVIKTIAIGYEPDVKKVIEYLKNKGYGWKKVIL